MKIKREPEFYSLLYSQLPGEKQHATQVHSERVSGLVKRERERGIVGRYLYFGLFGKE